jgi:hypothetical protein
MSLYPIAFILGELLPFLYLLVDKIIVHRLLGVDDEQTQCLTLLFYPSQYTSGLCQDTQKQIEGDAVSKKQYRQYRNERIIWSDLALDSNPILQLLKAAKHSHCQRVDITSMHQSTEQQIWKELVIDRSFGKSPKGWL